MTTKFTTTLNKIREHKPLPAQWRKLLKKLGKRKADDELLPLLLIVDKIGYDAAIWSCRTVDNCSYDFMLFAIWCIRKARRAQSPLIRESLDLSEKLVRAGKFIDNAGSILYLCAHGCARHLNFQGIGREKLWQMQEARFREMLIEGAFTGSTHS